MLPGIYGQNIEFWRNFRHRLHRITTFTFMCVVLWVLIPAWRRHLMETFAALLALCAGNSPVPGEFPAQRPVTRSFDVFFDLCLNKRLSKQSWGWWFETPSRLLWRHCNEGNFPQRKELTGHWCAILIAHQLLWQNMEAHVSIFQESPLAGEHRERLFHIHSVNRYQLRTK